MFALPVVDMEATGNNIKRLRKSKGLKVEDVSDYLGFTGPQAVYKWQRGDCLPEICNLLALSRLFGVTIEDILVEYGEDEKSSPVILNTFIRKNTYMVRF